MRANLSYSIPIKIKNKNRVDEEVMIEACELESTIPLLIGKDTQDRLGTITDRNSRTVICKKQNNAEFQFFETKSDHDAFKLESERKDMDLEEMICYIEETYIVKNVSEEDKRKELMNEKAINNIHKVSNHKRAEPMILAYENSGIVLQRGDRALIEKVIAKCNICKQTNRSHPRPKSAFPKVVDFNQVVTLDLKEMCDERGRKVHILWIICAFSRMAAGKVMRKKDAETTIMALNNGWNWVFGYPSRGYWSDNGTEFANKEMRDLCSRMKITIGYTTPWSPYSNGLNEKNHASMDQTIKKIMLEEPGQDLQTIVNQASWTHNTSTHVGGYTPLTLATGKAVFYPGLSNSDIATSAMCDSDR